MEAMQCDSCGKGIKAGTTVLTVDVTSFSFSANGKAAVSRLESRKDFCPACAESLRPKLRQLGIMA